MTSLLCLSLHHGSWKIFLSWHAITGVIKLYINSPADLTFLRKIYVTESAFGMIINYTDHCPSSSIIYLPSVLPELLQCSVNFRLSLFCMKLYRACFSHFDHLYFTLLFLKVSFSVGSESSCGVLRPFASQHHSHPYSLSCCLRLSAHHCITPSFTPPHTLCLSVLSFLFMLLTLFSFPLLHLHFMVCLKIQYISEWLEIYLYCFLCEFNKKDKLLSILLA